MGAKGTSVRQMVLVAAIATVLALTVAADQAAAETIVVDSTADVQTTNGECTFREAITAASIPNTDCGTTDPPEIDTIVFTGLAPGDHTIASTRDYSLLETVVIDAESFDGSITIDGAAASEPNDDFGLRVTSVNTVIKGLGIINWDQQGVKIDTVNDGSAAADGVQLIGNYIGVTETGTVGGNPSIGVSVGLPLADPTRHPDGVLIEDNVIAGNGVGIKVSGDDTAGTIIRGNTIGLGPDGLTPVPNTGFGIFADTGIDGLNVGGTGAGDGNLISANGLGGFRSTGTDTDPNTLIDVIGNTIGLDAAGNPAGNGGPGVSIGVSDENLIRGNTISANSGQGIGISDNSSTAGVSDTTIRGNRIGTNPAGDAVISNGTAAISIGATGSTGVSDTLIGGEITPGAPCIDPCNLIAGTNIGVGNDLVTGTEIIGNFFSINQAGTAGLPATDSGVSVTESDDVVIGEPGNPNVFGTPEGSAIRFGAGVSGGAVQSNLIGTDVTGTTELGFEDVAIDFQNGTGILVGGTAPGEGNLIRSAVGVHVGTPASGIALLGNSIVAEAGPAIDLQTSGGFGPTANDTGDADPGANNLQNFPDLHVAGTAGGVRIIGRLQGEPVNDFRVEVFLTDGDELETNGAGQSETLLGSFELSVDGSGSEIFDETVPGSFPPGSEISATATKLTGGGDPIETSETGFPIEHGVCFETFATNTFAILGTTGDDQIDGTPGDDVICASGGDDEIEAGGGDDIILGAGGTDTVTHDTAPGPVSVDLAARTSTGDGTDDLIDIENADGSSFADTLLGDGGTNVLRGFGGDDTITGRGGPDSMIGGADDDDLRALDGEPDTAIDCGPGTDVAEGDPITIDPDSIYVGCETITRADVTAPSLVVSGKKKQRSPKKVVVSAACDETCTVGATASGQSVFKKVVKKNGKKKKKKKKAKLKFKAVAATVTAGRATKLKLKPAGKSAKKLKQALKKKGKAKVVVAVDAADESGNEAAPQSFKVKLKR